MLEAQVKLQGQARAKSSPPQFINQESVIQVRQTYLDPCSLSSCYPCVEWGLLQHSSGSPIVEWPVGSSLSEWGLLQHSSGSPSVDWVVAPVSLCVWSVIHGSTWGVYFTWILYLFSVMFTIRAFWLRLYRGFVIGCDDDVFIVSIDVESGRCCGR